MFKLTFPLATILVLSACGTVETNPAVDGLDPAPAEGPWNLTMGMPNSESCTQSFEGLPGAILEIAHIDNRAVSDVPFSAQVDLVDLSGNAEAIALSCLAYPIETSDAPIGLKVIDCDGLSTLTFQPDPEMDAAWPIAVNIYGPITQMVPCDSMEGYAAQADYAAFEGGAWTLSLSGECVGSDCTQTEAPTDEAGAPLCIQSLNLSGQWVGCDEGENECRSYPGPQEDQCPE